MVSVGELRPSVAEVAFNSERDVRLGEAATQAYRRLVELFRCARGDRLGAYSAAAVHVPRDRFNPPDLTRAFVQG